MKLLLVNPFEKNVINGEYKQSPTLGLGFIATYIKSNSNWDVEVVEIGLQKTTREEAINKCKNADIVALTCYTESRFQVFNFAKEIKLLNNKCKIIVGGSHVNILDKLILRYYSFIDIIVRKEGEESILDIINNKPLKNIDGITWRNKNEIIRNKERTINNNINKFKYDYSIVYNKINDWKDLEIPLQLQKLNAIPIITSRGCLYQCTFCGASNQWNRKYRTLFPEEVVSRISDLVTKYNIGYFRFFDALFMANEQKALEFCDLLEKSKLKIKFRIDIKSGTSKKVIQRLKDVGCCTVGFGVESGSNRILKLINKCTTREKIEQTIKDCRDIGVSIIGFFMISIPGETREDIEKTLELVHLFDGINVQFFKVHPNTSQYDELVQNKIITDDIWFDPKYDNDLFWCKEIFPSALLTYDEAQSYINYADNKFLIYNIQKLYAKHGKTKAIIVRYILIIMNIMLLNKIGRKILQTLRNNNYIRTIYNYFIS